MTSGHGGARSGAGRRAGKPNKATKQAKATLADLAKQHTSAAINTLVEIMQSGLSETARLGAANSLLDRAYGKPIQATVEVDPEKTDLPFDGWTIGRVQPD